LPKADGDRFADPIITLRAKSMFDACAAIRVFYMQIDRLANSLWIKDHCLGVPEFSIGMQLVKDKGIATTAAKETKLIDYS
jgi:hypothetical protein